MLDLQFILEKILLWENIPVFLSDEKGEERYSNRDFWDAAGWWQKNGDLREHLTEDLKKKKYRICLEQDCFAYGAVWDEGGKQYALLGPVRLKDGCFGGIGAYRGLQSFLKADARLAPATLERLMGCVQLLYFGAYHEQLSYGQLLEERDDFPEAYQVGEKEWFAYEMKSAEEGSVPLPYQVELSWRAALREGERFEADGPDVFSRSGKMAKSSKKQTEYNAVVGIAIAARTVIEGGVSPARALRMADVYLQKLECCRDELQMRRVVFAAMEAFLQTVREAKKEGREEPAYIRDCKDYIRRCRTKHISLKDMADMLNLNYNYLSRKFKETEGMTIQQYMIREKLRAAANMIRYSDLSLTEISTYLDFSSQSHMGSRFKKEYGMTPKEYRQKYS